jgi:hypothetical protein
MTIADWIAANGLDAAFAYLKNTPGFAIMLRGMPTPAHIQPGLAKLGITTIDQLNATVSAIQQNIPNHRVLAEMIRPVPSFDLHTETKIGFNPTIHALINQQYDTSLVEPERFWHDDAKQSLLPLWQLQWLADNNPALTYQWNSGDERRDCDNSVRLTQGWLASMGLDDLAVGRATTIHYAGTRLVYVHAILLAVDDMQRVWQWDTMQGGLHLATECNLGNFSSDPANRCDKIKLYKVDF